MRNSGRPIALPVRAPRTGRHFGPAADDAFLADSVLAGTAVCTHCGVVHAAGRWYWGPSPSRASRIVCPACKRVRDGNAAHRVRIEGMPEEPRRRALAVMHHAEAGQRRAHPLQRLMLVLDEGGTLQFATTGHQLMRQVLATLMRVYRRDFAVDCTDERSTVLRWHGTATPIVPIG